METLSHLHPAISPTGSLETFEELRRQRRERWVGGRPDEHPDVLEAREDLDVARARWHQAERSRWWQRVDFGPYDPHTLEAEKKLATMRRALLRSLRAWDRVYGAALQADHLSRAQYFLGDTHDR